MEPEFWRDRWRQNQIGFHQGAPNALLERFAEHIVAGAEARVLVPLCGKAVDLAYLASRGAKVIGVELVEEAARAFFAEQRAPHQREQVGQHAILAGEGVSIIAGDFFAVDEALVRKAGGSGGPATSAYDRAALVALPPPMRERYAEHLLSLLPERGQILLITFEIKREGGPPFSVPTAEVERLFRAHADLELLAEEDATALYPMLAAQAPPPLVERAFLLTKR